MKVLVTGSHGSLGRAFLEYLKEHGIAYCTYDRANPENTEPDFTAVVNFAGRTPHSLGTKGKNAHVGLYEANVDGTRAILSHMEQFKRLRRFVHIGSAAEYGPSRSPLKESDAGQPDNHYGKSKLAQTNLIETFARTHKVKTINLRVFNLLGVPRHASQKRPYIDEFILSRLAAHARTLTVGNASDVRDYVDLRDVFRAILLALKTTKGKNYELINICSGKGTANRELVRAFAIEANREIALSADGGNATRYVGSRAKASRILGWKPSRSIRGIVSAATARKKRVLLVGAGAAGKLVLKELEKDVKAGLIVTGMVDDNPSKRATTMRGVKILGSIRDIPRLLARGKFDQILVATPAAGADVAARVAALAPPGFPIKVLPSISSVILGRVDLSYVRDIDAADLIGRPLIKTDQELISRKASRKTFLVTGGAGSIGSEIVRQLVDSKARKIVVLDSSEEGVFTVSQELKMKQHAQSSRVHWCIGNIRDVERIDEILAQHAIDVIVHAAAYKHVPLMEENPDEARKTNVQGTKNLLDCAARHKAKDFVLISTDKAVNPTNVMGRSKRDAELLVKKYAKRHPGMRISAVRFGNVLSSSGSMLPIFLKQIRTHSPITITHRDMTRYFMSIPEAVSLVLMSWVIAKTGQILLLDMGKPLKIIDLAETLVRLHGLTPYRDIPIIEIGVREGEKIHEELVYANEKLRSSQAPRIFIAEELS